MQLDVMVATKAKDVSKVSEGVIWNGSIDATVSSASDERGKGAEVCMCLCFARVSP
jgi:hypothetical protein